MNLARLILLILATLRLTRLITTDWLGEWAIVDPAKRWAADRADVRRDGAYSDEWRNHADRIAEADRIGDAIPMPPTSWGWRARLVNGLDCGYCLSPWIFGGLLIASAITSRIPGVGRIFAWLLATLSGSYVVGHLWDRLDNG